MNMQKLPRYLILLVSLGFFACVPIAPVAPRASKSEYLSLVDKAVGYLRESDSLFQFAGGVDSYKLSQAEAIFALAKELRPADPEAIDGIGAVYLRRGEIETARAFFLQCVSLDPEYGRAYVHLAYLEELEGRLFVSREWLEKAINLNPRDHHALNKFGGILYDDTSEPQNKERGKRMLLQALELGGKGSLVLEHNKKVLNK